MDWMLAALVVVLMLWPIESSLRRIANALESLNEMHRQDSGFSPP